MLRLRQIKKPSGAETNPYLMRTWCVPDAYLIRTFTLFLPSRLKKKKHAVIRAPEVVSIVHSSALSIRSVEASDFAVFEFEAKMPFGKHADAYFVNSGPDAELMRTWCGPDADCFSRSPAIEFLVSTHQSVVTTSLQVSLHKINDTQDPRRTCRLLTYAYSVPARLTCPTRSPPVPLWRVRNKHSKQKQK